ncbi:hypothetical protein AA313_de0205512 [Arthrobotrys entomopaga]|nr:hypothetical protein AA313_de0205512 [Arthrobotrys entomopaga]
MASKPKETDIETDNDNDKDSRTNHSISDTPSGVRERIKELSRPRALLLAAHYTSLSDIASLRKLVAIRLDVFTVTVTLELIVRFLAESVNVDSYAGFVGDVVFGNIKGGLDLDLSYILPINEPSAIKTLESLSFPPPHTPTIKPQPDENNDDKSAILLSFLHTRANAIDSETGSLDTIDSLVSRFIETDVGVYIWYTGIISVLKKLVYTCATTGEGVPLGGIGLAEFEALKVKDGVNLLLGSCVGEDGGVVEGFEMVAGYINYHRRLASLQSSSSSSSSSSQSKTKSGDGWRYVFEWILAHAKERFGVVWRIVRDWDGPNDEAEREGYLKAVIGACYLCVRTDEETVQQLQDVVYRIAGKVGVKDLRDVKLEEVDEFVDKFMSGRGSIWNIFSSNSHGVSEAVEEETAGELVKPTPVTLRLLEMLVVSTRMFAMFPLQLTVREVMRMKFSGSKEDQVGLLRRALTVEGRQRTEQAYDDLRTACEFLRAESKILGRLSRQEVEVEFLKDMLKATKFMLVTATYVSPKITRGRKATPNLLPPDIVEKVIVHAVTEFYDNSTNGNRTRGGMKNASNTLAILYPTNSSSLPLRRLSSLLTATHSLSEYSLTLTPGTPLKPVQVRLYPDPPDLISRVLQSNPKAYLQLDSLVKIALDLVYAVFKPHDNNETEPSAAENAAVKSRITGMCVEAALAEDDFETAFSFVVNKLVPTHRKIKDSSKTKGGLTLTTPDTAWKAALQAGRYRSPAMLAESIEGVATTQGIEQVQKRMELLSQALVICPPEAMMDVLRTWKQCEDELELLLEKEIQEDKAHAGKLGDWARSLAIPASMKSPIGGEALLKGPMSLLSVASTAGSLAKSLGSSAFPLRKQGESTSSAEGSQRGSGEYDRGWMIGEDGERVRKRDVLSGMVTSGLASGLGWVLGAKPEDMNAASGQRQ